jgi:type III secretory pathway lipoprotein EscJ
MLTDKQIQEQLTVLRVNFDPESPFKGMIDLYSEGGLMTLEINEQWQIHNAMSDDLKVMVFGECDEISTH